MCLSQGSPCASFLLQPDAREGRGGDGRGMEMGTVVRKGACVYVGGRDATE